MFASSEIHAVSVVDDAYVQHLGVALASMLQHLRPNMKTHIHVIENGLSRDNRNLLKRIANRYEAQLHYWKAKGQIPANLHISRHISEASYYKLLIPELLRDIASDRVLYLDCDVVVLGDVSGLWNTDMRGRAVAAVRDWGGDERCRELQIPDPSLYFNAGILLLDLKQWRTRNLSFQILSFAAHNPDHLYFHDQDAMNAILHREWLPLDAKWNYQTNMLTHRKFKKISNPVIVHFTGSSKPWHYDNDHPYKLKYYEFIKETDWHDFRPEKRIGARVKRMVKLLLPRHAVAKLARYKAKLVK
ncbi:general stress protein A [Paenibacillus glycanilyticus]|uniref:General stress protein A n=1 Tax=Paenibacillus glycanilyticus TaxID=126569 RepID=A0ABQ6NRB3_9BACL|nr:glycosyltransferase family 8 protein [Paenibacillus glycanilyticus]GMK46697.1 general stress protein A [Paenibacillus glycanilyticus]